MKIEESLFRKNHMYENYLAKIRAICSSSVYIYLAIAFTTLFAALLRLFKLGEWSFWYDELFTLRAVASFWELGLLDHQVSRILIFTAVSVLGVNEWSARLAPALIGVISVPVLYFLAKKIFGTNVALLAAIFLAVSPWHLYWSQNARFYTALLLFYTLALFFFYFGIEKDRPVYLVLFLVFMGFAILERLFALFILPVVVVYLVSLKMLPFEKPPGLRMRNIWLLLVPSLIGALFFIWEYIQDPSRWSVAFSRVNNNPFWILAGVAYYVRVPVLCLAAVGAIYLFTQRSRISLLLTISAILPLLSIMVISLFQYSANRYVFITLTSWIMLAAFAAGELFQQAGGKQRLLALGVVLILLVEPLSEDVLYYTYQHGNRDNWKIAFALINEQKKPEDLVAVSNPLIGDYYMVEKTLNIENMDLDDLPTRGNRVWFVEDLNVGERFPQKLDWIERNSSLVDNFDVHVQARNFKMRVYLFDPMAP